MHDLAVPFFFFWTEESKQPLLAPDLTIELIVSCAMSINDGSLLSIYLAVAYDVVSFYVNW